MEAMRAAALARLARHTPQQMAERAGVACKDNTFLFDTFGQRICVSLPSYTITPPLSAWHMLTLLAVVTGGPSKYQGRDLHEAHADLHITEDAFDRVVGHLLATLQELEVSDEDQQAILAAVQARRDAVVTFETSS